MSSFKRKEPVTLGARRLACDALEEAIQSLSRKQKRDPASQAAAALATARAAAELVGPALPRDTFRRDRKRLAEIAATLDDARLGRQLVNRLDQLAKSAGLDTADPAFKAVRKQLAQDAHGKVALRTAGQRFDPMVYRLVAELAELRGHVGLWPEGKADQADAPPPGLAALYRAARTAAQKAHDDPARLADAAAPVARLADALSLVNKCCPAMVKPQRAMLADAGKALDNIALDTQLARQLAQAVNAHALATQLHDAGQPDRDAAGAQLNTVRQYALAETPQALTKRVGAYWHAWRSV